MRVIAALLRCLPTTKPTIPNACYEFIGLLRGSSSQVSRCLLIHHRFVVVPESTIRGFIG